MATKDDLKEAAGFLQLCAGQTTGIEAAIHAMTAFILDDNTEGILSYWWNIFNALNRHTALQYLCPTLATILINIYRDATELFLNGAVLYSEEETTHGDLLAMPMYALATTPSLTK